MRLLPQMEGGEGCYGAESWPPAPQPWRPHLDTGEHPILYWMTHRQASDRLLT